MCVSVAACVLQCVYVHLFICVCMSDCMFLKLLKEPTSCIFNFFISPSSFLPAEGTGLRVYVFIVCPCVLVWFIMAISPRAAAGHLFLSPGALLVFFFFLPPSQSQLIEIQAVFCRP